MRDESPDFARALLVEDLSGKADGSSGVDKIVDEDGNLRRSESPKSDACRTPDSGRVRLTFPRTSPTSSSILSSLIGSSSSPRIGF